jgi:hypothetical protein
MRDAVVSGGLVIDGTGSVAEWKASGLRTVVWWHAAMPMSAIALRSRRSCAAGITPPSCQSCPTPSLPEDSCPTP